MAGRALARWPPRSAGELLEGVEPRHCPSFEIWLMLARGRCAARSTEELRQAALRLLAADDAESAAEIAGHAAADEPVDEGAQGLFLRALVAAGHPARAAVHLVTWPPARPPSPVRGLACKDRHGRRRNTS